RQHGGMITDSQARCSRNCGGDTPHLGQACRALASPSVVFQRPMQEPHRAITGVSGDTCARSAVLAARGTCSGSSSTSGSPSWDCCLGPWDGSGPEEYGWFVVTLRGGATAC